METVLFIKKSVNDKEKPIRRGTHSNKALFAATLELDKHKKTSSNQLTGNNCFLKTKIN